MSVITMALPGVTTDEERQELLHKSVLAYTDGEEGTDAALAVMRYAHESLSVTELERICHDYDNAVRTRDDLARDDRCWADHYADLGDPDPETAAKQIAADDVADAMKMLMFGKAAR
jgi:hypothetical protein